MRGKRQAAGRGDPFADEMPYPRTRRPKKRKKRGGLVLGFFLVAGAAAFLVWNFFIKKPDVSHNDKPGVTNNNPNDPNSNAAASGTADTPGGYVLPSHRSDTKTLSFPLAACRAQ